VVTEYETQNGPLPIKSKPIQETLKEKSIASSRKSEGKINSCSMISADGCLSYVDMAGGCSGSLAGR
jgi:hypothetical protein